MRKEENKLDKLDSVVACGNCSHKQICWIFKRFTKVLKLVKIIIF